MKKLTLATILCLMSSLLFAQSNNATTKTNPEPGFYTHKGCTKLDSISCYGFEDFSYIHEVTDLMRTFDRITYLFYIYSPTEKETDKVIYFNVDIKTFNAVIGENKVVRIPLVFFENIQYTRDKRVVSDALYEVRIEGKRITGYNEKWSENSRSIEKTPIYTSTILSTMAIPLKNRILIPYKTLAKFPIIGLFIKDTPIPERVITKDCYPCSGTPPEVFEFQPMNY